MKSKMKLKEKKEIFVPFTHFVVQCRLCDIVECHKEFFPNKNEMKIFAKLDVGKDPLR